MKIKIILALLLSLSGCQSIPSEVFVICQNPEIEYLYLNGHIEVEYCNHGVRLHLMK